MGSSIPAFPPEAVRERMRQPKRTTRSLFGWRANKNTGGSAKYNTRLDLHSSTVRCVVVDPMHNLKFGTYFSPPKIKRLHTIYYLPVQLRPISFISGFNARSKTGREQMSDGPSKSTQLTANSLSTSSTNNLSVYSRIGTSCSVISVS